MLLELIKQKAIHHSSASYILSDYRWDFPPVREGRKGVYIFIDAEGKDVLKVGKADRASGLAGRLNEYRASSHRYLLNPSSSASVIKRIQEGSGRQLEIEIYYIPIDPQPLVIVGIEIFTSPARELEQAIFTMARKAGHSLRFCRQKS